MAYGNLLADVVQSSVTGTPPQFNDGTGTQTGTLCRAWVNYKGTSTQSIRASFNVSSVTYNASGYYTINLTNAMPDANYSCVTSVSNPGGAFGVVQINSDNAFGDVAPTTSAIRIGIVFYNYTYTNSAYINAAIFR